MGCSRFLLPVAIVLPLIVILLLFDVVTVSYSELGLSANSAVVLLVVTLVGSLINIPISRRQVVYEESRTIFTRFFYYTPPRVETQTIAVTVGGALVPLGFSIYLLPRAAWWPTLVATLVVMIVVRLLAKPVPGTGIVIPFFIAPLISAALAFVLAQPHPAPVAFIAGTMGTLIGADILNWPNYRKLGARVVSIGGAGVFDGVFLTGIIAVLLASL